MQQRFRGNAAHVQADAAEVGILLDEDDVEAEVRRAECRGIATGPGPDDHKLCGVSGVTLRFGSRRGLDLLRRHALRAHRPVFVVVLRLRFLALCLLRLLDGFDGGDHVAGRDRVADRDVH